MSIFTGRMINKGLKKCKFCHRLYEKEENHPCFWSEEKQQKYAFERAKYCVELRNRNIQNDYWTSENEEEFRTRLSQRKAEEQRQWRVLLNEGIEGGKKEDRVEKTRLAKIKRLERVKCLSLNRKAKV